MGQLMTQSPSDADAQLARINEQIREAFRQRSGAKNGNSSEEEDAQMADLMKMMDEVRLMEMTHKNRKLAAAEAAAKKEPIAAPNPPVAGKSNNKKKKQATPSAAQTIPADSDDKANAIAALKTFVEEEGEGSEDESDDDKDTKDESRHQATVDAVMRNMEAYLPSFSDTHFDDQTLAMAVELLKDDSIRDSFVEMKGKLGPWLDTHGHNCPEGDRARYSGQFATTVAIVDLFGTDECVAVIASGPSATAEVVARVASRFNVLMEALNGHGEAPAGMYSQ
eukprot:GDKK01077840.1.p1 GENE.GDKK01077840.1~~GDKK01077840.1.p1  ORF type:complete len:289 (-),score=39.19 GDKK01077840.1:61-900(-)